jgi:hypothetical protein
LEDGQTKETGRSFSIKKFFILRKGLSPFSTVPKRSGKFGKTMPSHMISPSGLKAAFSFN